MNEEGLSKLQAVIDRTAAAIEVGDASAAVQANTSFHEELVVLAGSRVLASIMEPVGGRLRWLLSQHEDPTVMNEEHRLILAALRERDAERALLAFRQHLATSRSATPSPWVPGRTHVRELSSRVPSGGEAEKAKLAAT